VKYKAALSILGVIALASCHNESSQNESISTVLKTEAVDSAFAEEIVQFDSVLTSELFTKILNGDTEGFAKQLSLGADPDGKNSEGTPVLLSALEYNRIGIIKLLLRSKADTNCANSSLTTPLMQVVHNGNKAIDKTLDDGSVISIRPDSTFNKYLADLLISHGADIHAKDSNLETALMRAAALNNVDAVTYMLEKGSDPNQKNSSGQTSLMVSARHGFIDIAKSLIKGKADIAASDNEGQTVLIMAVQSNDPEMVSFLISKRALIAAQDVYGATPLKVATAMNHDKVAKVILDSLKEKELTELESKPSNKKN
jgi:ankyrin repeat protein